MKEDIAFEIKRNVAISEEIEASYIFIKEGLSLLITQKSALLNNHVPMQLLASGFERLAKILLILKEKHVSGEFPIVESNKNYFAKYDNGHGINKMIDELIEYSSTVESMKNIPLLIENIEFIKSDEKFRAYLTIITEFSKHQRYYYIDSITNLERKETNSFVNFKRLINSYAEEIDISKITYDEEEMYILLSMVSTIEKGVRSLSSFFTHGLGIEGKKHYGEFGNFILLRDKDFGKLKYTNPKVDPQNDYYPMKRSGLQFIMIKCLSKRKVISSHNFQNWPFLVNKVCVINYKKGKYCFVEIKDGVFALNGTASSHFKIPTYFASAYLKPRQYMIELLQIAQQL